MATLILPNLDAPEPTVSTHELARFLGGELTPARRGEIEALLSTDAAMKARADKIVSEQRAADAALKLEVPLERFLLDHAERAQGKSPLAWLKSLKMPTTLGVLAASAAAVFFLVRTPETQPVVPEWDGLKGSQAKVGFFVEGADDVRFGHEGEQLAPGSRIQFAVKDATRGSVMVLVGVDGRGAVTVYSAERIDSERAKGDPKSRLLSDSVVLDDSIGPERFFVVYADGVVDDVRETVERAAKELASSKKSMADVERLPLPPDSFVQSSVHIIKTEN